jgi:hypothetical protein
MIAPASSAQVPGDMTAVASDQRTTGAFSPKQTGYQPVNEISAERGPVFRFASVASLWIAQRPHLFGWRVEPITA